MKKLIVLSAFSAVFAIIALMAADSVKLQRLTTGIAGQGGAAGSESITNVRTYVISDSPTNEFSIEVTALNGKVGTAITNVYSPKYVATPTVVLVPKAGASAAYMTNFAFATVSTLNIGTAIVSGVEGVNFTNLSIITYGYRRTAITSQ